MVDKTLILRKLALLIQMKSELESYKIKSLDELRKNRQVEKALEKVLQEMIEVCFDIGKHIIADEGFRLPEDNKDIFRVLNEEGILSDKITSTMSMMSGFRNIIVHMYEKIDLEIVFSVYKRRLGDFERFAAEIRSFLSSR